MIQVTDWIYNPYKDSILLLFWAPELLAYIQCEINRHEDLTKSIEKLKEDIVSGKYFI